MSFSLLKVKKIERCPSSLQLRGCQWQRVVQRRMNWTDERRPCGLLGSVHLTDRRESRGSWVSGCHRLHKCKCAIVAFPQPTTVSVAQLLALVRIEFWSFKLELDSGCSAPPSLRSLHLLLLSVSAGFFFMLLFFFFFFQLPSKDKSEDYSSV